MKISESVEVFQKFEKFEDLWHGVNKAVNVLWFETVGVVSAAGEAILAVMVNWNKAVWDLVAGALWILT